MSRYNESTQGQDAFLVRLETIARLAGTFVGLAAMVLGLRYAMHVFDTVQSLYNNPAGLGAQAESWSQVVFNEPVEIRLPDAKPIPLNRVFGMLFLGGATLVLAWIALGIMVAGARMVSFSAGDREAVRAIVREVIRANPSDDGNGRKPPIE